jgi:type II secretory pathway pseudopilin PulG
VTRNRPAFALVASLVGVVLLGALIVGTFVASTEEMRTAVAIKSSARALAVAESSAEGGAAGWVTAQADSIPPGGRAVRTTAVDGFLVTTTLIRLNFTLFWLIADAEQEPVSAGTRRRIGVLFRRVADSTGRGSLFRLEERPWAELF